MGLGRIAGIELDVNSSWSVVALMFFFVPSVM